jgi:hypothetical protein
MDPEFRVHQLPDTTAVEALSLRLNDPYSGTHHLFIGERSSLFSAIQAGYRADTKIGTFRAVQMILDRTIVYDDEKRAFLSTLAQEMIQEQSLDHESRTTR